MKKVTGHIAGKSPHRVIPTTTEEESVRIRRDSSPDMHRDRNHTSFQIFPVIDLLYQNFPGTVIGMT